MVKLPLFYQVYDLLYQKKPYREEAKYAYDILTHYSPHRPTSLLEIGCGTGNHTQAFAHYFTHITAVDIDQNMIMLAKRKKIPAPITFTTTPVGQLPLSKFSAAVALFNVINYINEWETLTDFFAAIRKRLQPKSVFLFDVWNGIAALVDPPKIKHIKLTQGGQRIYARIKPTLDRFTQTVTLEYQLTRTSKTTLSDTFTIKHRLWTPFELTEALKVVGFSILTISPLWQPQKRAKETDYKIMFVCQK